MFCFLGTIWEGKVFLGPIWEGKVFLTVNIFHPNIFFIPTKFQHSDVLICFFYDYLMDHVW